MERLDFSTLWMNERWSDVTLVIKPRRVQQEASRDAGAGPGPSSSDPAGANTSRRITRSMDKGSPALLGRQQAKAQVPSPASPAPAQRKGMQTKWPGSPAAHGTVRASRGSRSPAASSHKFATAATTSLPNDGAMAAPASAGKQSTLSQLSEGSIIIPAHAVVLISTSEYFKRYFDSWHPHDGSKVVSLEVEPEEVNAARLMLRYMYTGQLPPGDEADPAQLLRLVKLADQFSVTRFLSACNSALAHVPLDRLTLDHVRTILALPPFLLEGQGEGEGHGDGQGAAGGGAPLAVARRRAEEKLVQVFGDLEGAWFDAGRRQEFLRLPLTAVKFLLGRTETAVYNENTALVALTDWIANNTAAAASTAADGGAGAGDKGGGGGGGEVHIPTGTAAAAADGAATASPVPVSLAPATPGAVPPGATPAATSTGIGPSTSTLSPPGLLALGTGRTGEGGALVCTASIAAAAAAAAGVATTAAAGGGADGDSALSDSQLDELFNLMRLPHLSSAYMSLLPHIGWVRQRLTPALLARVLQLVKAAEAAGGPGAYGGGGSGGGAGGSGNGGGGRPQVGLYGSNGALEVLQRLTGTVAVPRAVPERTALELEWTLRISDVQALIAECRAEECPTCACGRAGGGGGGGGPSTSTGAGAGGIGTGGEGGGSGGCDHECGTVESTRLFSEPAYYYAGFYWRMCFFVQKKVTHKRRRLRDLSDTGAGGLAAAAGGGPGGGGGGGANAIAADGGGGRGGEGGGARECSAAGGEVAVYQDFLGVTCRAVLGGEEFAPLTSMQLELAAVRFTPLGEPLAPQRAEVPGYVDDEVPYGVYDFFRQDNLSDAAQLSGFTCGRGLLHLSCKITRCS